MKPTVSVVIPVRNGKTVIDECLDSLREQTYPNADFEVVVVDDESTDDTAELLEAQGRDWEAAGDAPALRVVRQSWGGAGVARNRGVAESRGDIVLFTDADCAPTADWVEVMVAPLADPEVAAVAGGYLTKQGSLVARLAQAEFEQRYRFIEQHSDVDFAFTHSAAVRREAFLAIGGFDERMPNNADDLELSYRLIDAGYRIKFERHGLVYHRHPATWFDYTHKKFGRGYWRAIVLKRFPSKAAQDSYTPQTLKLEIVLLGLTGLISAAAILGVPFAGWLALLTAGLLLLTTLPFAFQLRGSLAMRLAAPLFVVLRAGALGSGAVLGMFDRLERYEVGGKRKLASS